MILAGGGGGTSPGADTDDPAAGGGGGLTGGEDGVPTDSGRGGSQTAGGAGATNATCARAGAAGSRLHGGAGAEAADAGGEGGGGGGGGYFGGGGGGCQQHQSAPYNGAGGGGSGYLGGAGLTDASSSSGDNGTGTFPSTSVGGAAANSGDPEYVADVGRGGAFEAGGNGLIVLQYTARPSAALGFTPSTIAHGATSVLAIRLTNANTSAPFTGASLRNTYPADLRNADKPRPTTTCRGGSVSAAAGGGSVLLTGGVIPASGFCEIRVHVTSTATGRHADVLAAGALTTAGGGRSAEGSIAALRVLPAPPTVSVSFAPRTVASGEAATLTVRLLNPGDAVLHRAGFRATLPAGLTLASPVGARTTCGGRLTASPDSRALRLVAGRIPTSGCSVRVTVTAAKVGRYAVTVAPGAVTTAAGVVNAHSAGDTLTVTAADAVASTGVPVAGQLTLVLVLLGAGGGLLLLGRRRRC